MLLLLVLSALAPVQLLLPGLLLDPFLLLAVELVLTTLLRFPRTLLFYLLLPLPRTLLLYLLLPLPRPFPLLVVPLHLLLAGAFLLLVVQLVLTTPLRFPRTLLLYLLLLLPRPFLLAAVPLHLLLTCPFLPVLIGRPPLLGTVRLPRIPRPFGPVPVFLLLLFLILSAAWLILLRVPGTHAEHQAQGGGCDECELLHERAPLNSWMRKASDVCLWIGAKPH